MDKTPLDSLRNFSLRKFSQWICSLLVLTGLVSCQKNVKDFSAPEIVSADATVVGSIVTFSVTFTDNRIEECGVLIKGEEQDKLIKATLINNGFELTVTGLTVDVAYTWNAYAKAGGQEIRSAEQSLTVPDGAIPIPDPAFKAWLTQRYDMNHDGELSLKEAQIIWRIDFCSNQVGVKSVSGIEYMPNLEELRCWGEWCGDFNLDRYPYYYLSKHYHWDEVFGPVGTLESLDISRNPKLRVLDVSNNSALGDLQGILDISNNPALEALNLNMTYMVMPDVSALEGQLTEVLFSHLRGPFPNFSRMPGLKKLEIAFEQTGRKTAIDVSQCPLLEELLIGGSGTSLSNLQLNPELQILDITCCDFHEINLSMLPHLRYFSGKMNFLKNLDVSANPELWELNLSPMNDDVLETLYIAPGQVIPGVTEGRSSMYIPDYTQIKEKSVK